MQRQSARPSPPSERAEDHSCDCTLRGVRGWAYTAYAERLGRCSGYPREGSIVSYNEQVGERLRSIRRQRGFSLQDVQRISEGEFKAAVLGAYERGERSLSVPRLHRLAGYYGVPVVQLLPPDPAAMVIDPDRETVTIDLGRLGTLEGPEGDMIERFLSSIQMERQDFNGKVLTVRHDDLRLLSRLIGESDEFTDRIDEVRISLRP